MVYVLDSEGKPLMPTERHGKVRRMLRDGRATVVRRRPFTVRLTYGTPGHVQRVSLGVDAGTATVEQPEYPPLRELGIPAAALTRLRRAGVATTGDLVGDIIVLASRDGIGEGTLAQAKAALGRMWERMEAQSPESFAGEHLESLGLPDGLLRGLKDAGVGTITYLLQLMHDLGVYGPLDDPDAWNTVEDRLSSFLNVSGDGSENETL